MTPQESFAACASDHALRPGRLFALSSRTKSVEAATFFRQRPLSSKSSCLGNTRFPTPGPLASSSAGRVRRALESLTPKAAPAMLRGRVLGGLFVSRSKLLSVGAEAPRRPLRDEILTILRAKRRRYRKAKIASMLRNAGYVGTSDATVYLTLMALHAFGDARERRCFPWLWMTWEATR